MKKAGSESFRLKIFMEEIILPELNTKPMRLFHVSEEKDIAVFEPRFPTRTDLDKSIGLVWAIDEAHLTNFLTPRNCPRVAYSVGENTTAEDRERFFCSSTAEHAVIIESEWFDRMCETWLFLYEFEPTDFVLQDKTAGYYVATTAQKPIEKHIVTNLFTELFRKNSEVRIVDSLWDIAECVKQSSLDWSLCRMGFAKKQNNNLPRKL